MNFQQYDLGQQKRGATAVVTLQGNAANVRLMDSSSLSAYKNGRRHNYTEVYPALAVPGDHPS